MHRTIPILLLMLILAVCTVCAQTLSLDKCLDDLAEKQSLGPVVAVMRGPAPGTADLSSLEGLAKTFGLKLFEQDGIHILGPAECIHLYDLSEFFPKERPKRGLSPEREFLNSLTPEQLKAAGSRDGLHFADLSGRQQAIVKRMFTGRAVLIKRPDKQADSEGFIPPPPTLGDDGQSYLTEDIPNPLRNAEKIVLSSVPLEDLTVRGSVIYTSIEVTQDGDEISCDIPAMPDLDADRSERLLYVRAEPDQTLPAPPRPSGPNVLKPSQLDYERPELQKHADFPVRATLRDVVAVAAKESGLPFFVGPGSEKVALYVRAGTSSIGQVLKAVSLATGGTWRKVGDLFVYTLDITGLGAFTRREFDLTDLSEASEEYVEPPFDAWRVREVMLNLFPKEGTTFSLTSQQITDLTAVLADNPSETACRIPWVALTPEQQAAALKECDHLKSRQLDQQYLIAEASAELSFHFPGLGNANAGYWPSRSEFYFDLLPPDQPYYSPALEMRQWPRESSIPMPPGVRGAICRVSKSDTPASVVTAIDKYGLNTLLIRVFSDGYTIFPSKQFPQLPGLKADDFLRNVIAVAHAKGIRVVGIVDALRWSDGDPKHWLYKNKEIVDVDVTGRMNSEWAAQRLVSQESAIEERITYGDAFDGDFVSPFHLAVREKLSALVRELTSYDLDGVAFDHTSILRPDSQYIDEYPSDGQTGFTELARSAFIRAVGVDPVDIIDQDVIKHVPPTPLTLLAGGAASQSRAWDLFYRAACDALLDMLVEDSRKVMPETEVWVVDTYRDIYPMEIMEAHGWSSFDRRVGVVVGLGAGSEPDYASTGIKGVQLVRVTDFEDLLYLGTNIALLQHKTFAGMLPEEDLLTSSPDKPIKDIIFDFACGETRKTEFLKLLETARPAKTR